ncbi:MAG: ASPIC/UnbV domain-containing protein [Lewinellaceae bacterium]|nr:ASPIC/UnbV domain-containing protein [Lewinellaceae bacterium]
MLQNFNTRGFQSSIEPEVIFGLGNVARIDRLEVTWPDKRSQVLTDIAADRTLVLMQEKAAPGGAAVATEMAAMFREVGGEVIKGNARHVENRQNDFDQEILLPRMLSTEGPRLAAGDVNNDRLEDFILLGATGIRTSSSSRTRTALSAFSLFRPLSGMRALKAPAPPWPILTATATRT